MKMNKAVVDARRNKIMQKIQSQGRAAVEDLAEELQVSPLTIRRDLQFWEEMGAVMTHSSLTNSTSMPSQNMPHSMYRKVIRYLSIQAQLHCLC